MAGESPPKKIAYVLRARSDAADQGPMAENCPGHKEPCNIPAVALSNFLILKRIFTCLTDEDLDACLQVSPLWKSVAEPLVVPHYDIQLKNDRAPSFFTDNDEGFYSANQVVIKQRTYRSNEGNDTKERTLNFHYGAEKLTEITQARKVAISLAVAGYGDFEFGKLYKVLPIFGKFVVNLYARSCEMGVSSFCRQILKDFPNLRCLNFYGVYLLEDDYNQGFDPLLPQNKLQHLRKIDLRGVYCRNSCLVTILKTASNLEEIHNLPIFLAESLVETQKASLLKSICYKSMYCSDYEPEENPFESPDETFCSAFEKLAKLCPKLSSFSFELKGWAASLEASMPCMLQILRSSSNSLRSLTVVPSVSVGFQEMPPFTSLKEIKFILKSDFKETPPRIFPEEIVLLQQFPSVSEIDIHLPDSKYISGYFPANMFSPWGTQIQTLKISLADAETIKLLGKIFPSLKSFAFEMIELPDNLNSIIETVSQVWPELESLHAKIDERYIEYWGRQEVEEFYEYWEDAWEAPARTEYRYKPLRGHSLDSAITGIPDDTLVRLKRDSLLRPKLSEEQIQKFREESTVRKLTKLKILKFDFDNRYTKRAAVEKLSTLTPLSYEFGFKFLPGLKVIVKTRRDFQCLEDLEKTFQPLKILEIEREPLIPSSSP